MRQAWWRVARPARGKWHLVIGYPGATICRGRSVRGWASAERKDVAPQDVCAHCLDQTA